MRRGLTLAIVVVVASLICWNPTAAQQRLASERLLTLAISVAVGSLIFSKPTATGQRPAGENIGRVQIISGPALESVTDDSATIRWTTNTGKGLVRRYGVVRYGTDPRHLSQTAHCRNGGNESLSYVKCRVYVDGLKPGTTYYFAVDSGQADGSSTGLTSTMGQFTTRHKSTAQAKQTAWRRSSAR